MMFKVQQVFLALTRRIPVLTAFQYRNYRLYWSGMLVATMGAQILAVSLSWLVYDMTGSKLYLGVVGGAQGITTIVFNLFGGVLADRVDRRRLILFTNFSFSFLILALAIAVATRIAQPWHLVVFASLFGMVTAFDTPSRQALIPDLIEERKHLMNAIALHSIIWQSSRVLGPMIAGILFAVVGLQSCFFVAAATYLAMVAAMVVVRPKGTMRKSGQSVRAAVVEGLKYVRRSAVISSIMGMVFLNSVFGISFVYLMPIFAKDILKVSDSGFAYLMTAMGIGTLCGGILTAASSKLKMKNFFLLGASILYGIFLISFSLSHSYVSSLILIGMVGFTQQIYMVTAQTLVQWLVSEEVRGRVMGIYSMVWSLSPVGSLQAAAVANAYGAPVAVALGGAVVAGFAIFLTFALPHLRKLEV